MKSRHWGNHNMRTAGIFDYVIARVDNVVHVDFDRDTRPPKPTFPGAGALRAESSNAAHANSHRPSLLDHPVRRQTARG
jgi:hypothetical protein